MDERADLRPYLYTYGFLMTNDSDISTDGFPFYGHWRKVELDGQYRIYAHPKTTVTIINRDGHYFIMMGHAYDPYHKLYDEKDILRNLADHYGTDDYRTVINSVTGLFVYVVLTDGQLEFEVDATGLQLSCHAHIDQHFMIASHAQMLDDLYGLKKCEIVQRLVNYKWYYRVKGPYLPCDLTPYSEARRLIPDITYRYDGEQLSHARIFPLNDPIVADTEEDYNEVIREGADVLSASMEMIAHKWERPYISLTGGIDSNTCFAAANGLYDRFGTFTYVSAPKEEIDAEASKKITDHFGVHHLRLDIPESSEGLADYEHFVHIMKHNSGYVTKQFDNEYRKRVFLIHHLGEVDVEVKSWSSEAIRGYFYTHFARKRLPRCTPKVYRNLYKLFFLNRSLARAMDKQFKSFMEVYEFDRIPESLIYDMFYTEVSMGSWGAQNLAEMRMYSELTSVFNNRRFLNTMFRVPLDKRISNQNHLDMKRLMNRELYDLNIRVINKNETQFRARMLNIIFNLNNWLPF